jgi:predicted CXXCH cytochrome family protein
MSRVSIYLLLYFLLLIVIIIPAAQSEMHDKIYNLVEVHSWPDSKCDICHTSSHPDADSASLIISDQSRLCESCHEGTVEILPNSKLKSRVEPMNNHPIKFSPLDFDPDKVNHTIIKEGKYFYVSGQTGKVPLFGDTKESAVAECSTCHDGHGKSRYPKLHSIDNSKSQICLVCHINYYGN